MSERKQLCLEMVLFAFVFHCCFTKYWILASRNQLLTMQGYICASLPNVLFTLSSCILLCVFSVFPAMLHKLLNFRYLLSVTNTQCQTAAGQLLKVTGRLLSATAVFRNWTCGERGVVRSDAFVWQAQRQHWRYFPPLGHKTGVCQCCQ